MTIIEHRNPDAPQDWYRIVIHEDRSILLRTRDESYPISRQAAAAEIRAMRTCSTHCRRATLTRTHA